ncbi:MAG: TRAP transporter TatT component family protein [Nitrosomonas sp.]|uniref:TRAP transporter TatT component family protein n=1 Tax=Nitrosomonas sp. TaxID=42353 RepID=UPI0025CDA553|nr:TRAP transporter TatT component family protein [Nitrosomonas sp.]MBY0475963.1 TRAP transporter TatT component family protein [Nitrosomonas sp.]
MSNFIKSNLKQLKKKLILFICGVVALICLTSSVLAHRSASTVLTLENQQKIELAAWKYAIDTPLLLETIDWFRDLTRNSRESAALAELARLKFMRAQLELDKHHRVHLFERSIAMADQALALNANDVRGLFWKAAAMGKIAEDSGMLNALRMLRPMEDLLLKVVELDERYENAGAHRALGRMYHKLPRFPISFGSNQKALAHLKRAYGLFPQDIITRAFYAELLYEIGRKYEARKHADFVLTTPIAEEDALEFTEYVDIALEVVKKTGGANIKVGNY